MPPKFNYPLTLVENTVFGPSTFPSGGATAQYVDYPKSNAPMQTCSFAEGDAGNYLWNRSVDCYIGIPGSFGITGTSWTADTSKMLKIDAAKYPTLCKDYNAANKITFPAYRADNGAAYAFTNADVLGTSPVSSWAYPAAVPACQPAYNVSAWQPRQPK
jgi:hypothetical protein